MMDFIKKYYKHLLLVVFYSVLALTIYIIWFNSLWHLWYVDVITALVILGISVFLGYDYMKGVIKEEMEKEAKAAEPVAENKEEATVEVVENNETVEEAKDGE